MCGEGRFGARVDGVSRGARVIGAGAVISGVAVSGLLLLASVPEAWWLITIYGWVVFPAFRLLGSELPRLEDESIGSRSLRPVSQERQLLEALGRHGSLTPARAAMETSLSVSEAEGLLWALANGGHLEVRVRDGGLFYAMWDAGEDDQREDARQAVGSW
ncbi:MAG: hypothetical protein ACR2KW_01845 [Rubrobacter sp.]